MFYTVHKSLRWRILNNLLFSLDNLSGVIYSHFRTSLFRTEYDDAQMQNK